jgi:hypothetical protein
VDVSRVVLLIFARSLLIIIRPTRIGRPNNYYEHICSTTKIGLAA